MPQVPGDVEAVYANRVSITISPQGVRLSFGDQVDQENPIVYFRAVFLPLEYAHMFKDLLTSALAQQAAPAEAKPN